MIVERPEGEFDPAQRQPAPEPFGVDLRVGVFGGNAVGVLGQKGTEIAFTGFAHCKLSPFAKQIGRL